MVRRTFFAGIPALTASVLFGAPPALQHPHSPVGIYMDFDHAPEEISLTEMKKEVEKILHPSGVQIGWRLSKENKGTESFADVVFFRFRGKCRVEYVPVPPNDFGTLGETVTLGYSQVRDERVLPFSEVECDQVRKSLSYLGMDATSLDRKFALGRALGYVVAHELYHILARTTEHASAGLAKASETWKDLVSGALTFKEGESKAIEEGVKGNHATFSFR